MNINGTKDELYVFKDMCISALRYALPRHTYIVQEVCNFIIENASVIVDTRTRNVMLCDIDEQLKIYEEETGAYKYLTMMEEIDKNTIKDLRGFLENYEINS